MANIKVFRGLESTLDDQEKQDGCIYFCTDTGNVFIDCEDSESALTRIKLSDKLPETNKVLYSIPDGATSSWAVNDTIEFPEFNNYSIFQITMEGSGCKILAMRHGNFLRGVGGYCSATPEIFLYGFAATYAETETETETKKELTLVACYEKSITANTSPAPKTVTSIIGII